MNAFLLILNLSPQLAFLSSVEMRKLFQRERNLNQKSNYSCGFNQNHLNVFLASSNVEPVFWYEKVDIFEDYFRVFLIQNLEFIQFMALEAMSESLWDILIHYLPRFEALKKIKVSMISVDGKVFQDLIKSLSQQTTILRFEDVRITSGSRSQPVSFTHWFNKSFFSEM